MQVGLVSPEKGCCELTDGQIKDLKPKQQLSNFAKLSENESIAPKA